MTEFHESVETPIILIAPGSPRSRLALVKPDGSVRSGKSRGSPMPSMQDTKTDPHDVLEIAPDVVLVARAAADFPSLAPGAAHRLGERQPNMGPGFAAAPAPPTVDTSFRATDTSGGRTRGGWARKALFTFLFTSCSALAVAAWQHYGDDAQEMAAGL